MEIDLARVGVKAPDPCIQGTAQPGRIIRPGKRGRDPLGVRAVGSDQCVRLAGKVLRGEVVVDGVEGRIADPMDGGPHREQVLEAGTEVVGSLALPLGTEAETPAVVDPVGHTVVTQDDVLLGVADHVPVAHQRISDELAGELGADRCQLSPPEGVIGPASDELRHLGRQSRAIGVARRRRDGHPEGGVDAVGGDFLPDMLVLLLRIGGGTAPASSAPAGLEPALLDHVPQAGDPVGPQLGLGRPAKDAVECQRVARHVRGSRAGRAGRGPGLHETGRGDLREWPARDRGRGRGRGRARGCRIRRRSRGRCRRAQCGECPGGNGGRGDPGCGGDCLLRLLRLDMRLRLRGIHQVPAGQVIDPVPDLTGKRVGGRTPVPGQGDAKHRGAELIRLVPRDAPDIGFPHPAHQECGAAVPGNAGNRVHALVAAAPSAHQVPEGVVVADQGLHRLPFGRGQAGAGREVVEMLPCQVSAVLLMMGVRTPAELADVMEEVGKPEQLLVAGSQAVSGEPGQSRDRVLDDRIVLVRTILDPLSGQARERLLKVLLGPGRRERLVIQGDRCGPGRGNACLGLPGHVVIGELGDRLVRIEDLVPHELARDQCWPCGDRCHGDWRSRCRARCRVERPPSRGALGEIPGHPVRGTLDGQGSVGITALSRADQGAVRTEGLDGVACPGRIPGLGGNRIIREEPDDPETGHRRACQLDDTPARHDGVLAGSEPGSAGHRHGCGVTRLGGPAVRRQDGGSVVDGQVAS